MLHFRQQPRHQYIRAEDNHEADRDRAAVGKHYDDPASRREKETRTLNAFRLT